MATSYKRIPNRERKLISQERLRELLRYDPETGNFIRVGAARPQSAYHIGEIAGYIKPGTVSSGGGYRMLSLDGRVYRAHKLAWFYVTGEWPVADIDHINGIRDDNRWANLRPASRSQNLGNSRMPFDSLTGIKGVTFDKSRNKWAAQIGIGWDEARGYYNTKHLGRYNTPEEAADAYRKAAIALFGEFARTE